MLAPFVQCYWAIGESSSTLTIVSHGVIPGGYVDFVFNLGDQIYLSDSSSIFFDKARSFVAGPFDRFRRLYTRGKFEILGVRFHLGRAPFDSHLPLGEVQNGSVPLDAVWEDQGMKTEIQTLEFHLAQVPGTMQRIVYVERFLMKLIRRWKEPDAMLSRALGLIKKSHGQIAIETLASTLGISARQLERKFKQHIGLSPKVFCRVTRFHQVQLRIEITRGSSGCELAYECGYYDQTHLNHEFRLFTGQTPTRYKKVQPVGFFLYER